MKIYKLIEMLSAFDPQGDIEGVEGLKVTSPLFKPGFETSPPTKRTYLKGNRRAMALLDPRPAHEVAKTFDVPVEYIIELRAKAGGKGQ